MSPHAPTWSVARLGELVKLTSGQSPSSFKFGSTGKPYFKVDQLGKSTKYLGRASTPYHSSRMPEVPAGSVLIAKRGGAIALDRVRLLTEPGFMDTNVMALSPTKDIESEFLYYWLSHRGLWDIADVTSVPQINNKHINPLAIALPRLAEQRAIVKALRESDDLIAILERQIAKKQAIKQGMMQQLLTGETRLPGFDRPWSESSIGDLAQIVSGGTPKSSVPNYWDGGVAWCTPTDITHQKGRFLRTTERTITQEGLEHSGAQLLPAGSLLLCTRATIGEVKIATKPIATNQGFKSLIPRARVSGEYLYYKILTLKDDLAAKGTGSTFLEVSKRDVAALTFEVPGYDEQIAIASVFSDADDELTLLRERLDKACSIKRGIMQELLTGRTRLPAEVSS